MISSFFDNGGLIASELEPVEISQLKSTILFIGEKNFDKLCKKYIDFFYDYDDEKIRCLIDLPIDYHYSDNYRRTFLDNCLSKRLVKINFEKMMVCDITYDKLNFLYENESTSLDSEREEFEYCFYKGTDYFVVVNFTPFKERMSYYTIDSFERYIKNLNEKNNKNKFFQNYFLKNREINSRILSFLNIVVEMIENNNDLLHPKTIKDIILKMFVFKPVIFLMIVRKDNTVSIFSKKILKLFRGSNPTFIISNINYKNGKPLLILNEDTETEFFCMGYFNTFVNSYFHFSSLPKNEGMDIKDIKYACFFTFKKPFSIKTFDYFGVFKSFSEFFLSGNILDVENDKCYFDFISIEHEDPEEYKFSSFYSSNDIRSPFFIEIIYNTSNSNGCNYKISKVVWNVTDRTNITKFSNSLGASIIKIKNNYFHNVSSSSFNYFYKKYIVYGKKGTKYVFKNLKELLMKNKKEKNLITKILLTSSYNIKEISHYF